jgi:hypothetical protein
LVGLSACQTIPTKTYEVRQRAFTYKPTTLAQDYQEEYAYIQNRRRAVLYFPAAVSDLQPSISGC